MTRRRVPGRRAHAARADRHGARPTCGCAIPVLYRIRHASHHHTGDRWCIYPMYDFAHGLSDYIEGVTHSICTLEFVPHRPLYDWLLEALDLPRPLPHQYEFARLNVTHTRDEQAQAAAPGAGGLVRGWDDPRMPTISRHAAARLSGRGAARLRRAHRRGAAREPGRAGAARALRARGPQPPRAAAHGGAAAAQGRDRELPRGAGRGASRLVEQPGGRVAPGTRRVPFSRELWIEQDDFREMPPPKYFRLEPGRRGAAARRLPDPLHRRGQGPRHRRGRRGARDLRSRRPAAATRPTGARSRPRSTGCRPRTRSTPRCASTSTLFTRGGPGGRARGRGLHRRPQPRLARGAAPAASSSRRWPTAAPGTPVQFERVGYFCADARDSRPGAPVFNRTVTLKDAWARIEKRENPKG